MTGFSTSKLFQLFQDYFWRLKWPFSCSSSITVLQNSVLKIVSLSIFQVQFKYRPRIAWEIGDSQRHLSRGNSTRVEKGIHLTILFFTLVTFNVFENQKKMSFGSKYSKLHLARKFKFICFVKRRCSLRSQCWKMRLFVVTTFKHCVASFLKVCSRQPFAGHRCQKRDKNSAPTLDCLHGGIPHLVLRFGLYHVRLQHDSRLRCGCGYSPTLQLYHHDRVRKKH